MLTRWWCIRLAILLSGARSVRVSLLPTRCFPFLSALCSILIDFWELGKKCFIPLTTNPLSHPPSHTNSNVNPLSLTRVKKWQWPGIEVLPLLFVRECAISSWYLRFLSSRIIFISSCLILAENGWMRKSFRSSSARDEWLRMMMCSQMWTGDVLFLELLFLTKSSVDKEIVQPVCWRRKGPEPDRDSLSVPHHHHCGS